MPARIPYLMYHELERPGRALCSDDAGYVRYVVRESDFDAQLRSMRARGVMAVSVGGAMAPGVAAQRVVLTFDDGCESDLAIAAPMLAAHGYGATFYVTTGFLGRRGFMVPRQVRELADLGFEIGCHAATHRYLVDLPTKELDAEIAGAKQALEEMTGRPVLHFSCPGGRWDQRVIDVARQSGFLSVATSDIGVNAANSYRLDRIAILRETSLERFERVCAGRGLLLPRLTTEALQTAKRVLGNKQYERIRSAFLR